MKSIADEIENTSESDGEKYIKQTSIVINKPIFKARRDIEKYIKQSTERFNETKNSTGIESEFEKVLVL